MTENDDSQGTTPMDTTHETVAAIEEALGVSGVSLSLTDHGRDVVGRLGATWFVAAVRSLALAHPGSPLELVLEAVSIEPFPRPVPIHPSSAGGMYGEGRAIGRISVPAAGGGSAPVVSRVLIVPSAQMLEHGGGFEFIAPTSLKRRVAGRVYKELYRRAPLSLDRWRQQRNSQVIGHRASMAPISPALTSVVPQRHRSQDGRPVAWLALHWLETGGAESWAFDAARLAREAGYEVVMTADVPAPQRELERALAVADHVYLPANALAEEDWGQFLENLVVAHDISLVHIHHSARAYGFLPELRHRRPSTVVIDSTHIVEHRTGGFVKTSIEYSQHIDEHHVISPELRDLYLLDSHVEPSKVRYHPLTSPRPGTVPTPVAREGRALRIGFLGRLAPQKRPFLFVEMARRLHARHPDDFTFVMQGSGVLDELTSGQIARAGLVGVIERRAWGPVDDFLSSIDVLVVSSDNEGLTLTTLEAEQFGVLVLSADVGSQRTVIAPQVLVPREPAGFLRESVAALTHLATTPGAFETAARVQTELATALSAVESAATYLTTTLRTHKEPS